MRKPKTLSLLSDFVLSSVWVCSSPLIKLFIHSTHGLALGHEPFFSEIIRYVFSIINMFLFAFLGKITGEGSYNPLTALSGAVSGDAGTVLFTLSARIPAQVLGSIYGVRLLINAIPEIGRGPKLNVDIHRGALTEGLLAFVIVSVSLSLTRSMPGSFFRKTWISSASKLTLQILGSDLTGGVMNPASVMGWAYARGDHISKEHLLVYWLAPVLGSLLAVWIFRLLFKSKGGKDVTKSKSE
ncbi:hypothetical protein Droror1_Dr00009722 [Drosera rotundifolia]